MERLTQRNNMGIAVFKQPYECERCNEPIYRLPDYGNGSPTDRLCEYEDLAEQGRLPILPCVVGDTAYYLHRTYLKKGKWINEIDEVEVDSFIFNINLFVNVSYHIGSETFRMTLTPYKTLFFTKEEAEAALEKMKGEEHE